MTPEERGLITGLFERLKSAEGTTKDREADDLINRLVVQQPSTPYLLTQTVLVQEHALKNAQTRIAQLESELTATKQSGGEREAGSTGSFLGGLMGRGPWGARSDASAPTSASASQPAAAASAPRVASAPAPSGSVPFTAPAGGSFLQQALSTAAGVAGGALLFDGIRSLFFHNPGPFGPALGSGWGPTMGGQPLGGMSETNIVNNYYGNDPATADPSGGGTVDAGYTPDANATDNNSFDDSSNSQDADAGGFDTASDFDSGGGDFGGGDDFSST